MESSKGQADTQFMRRMKNHARPTIGQGGAIMKKAVLANLLRERLRKVSTESVDWLGNVDDQGIIDAYKAKEISNELLDKVIQETQHVEDFIARMASWDKLKPRDEEARDKLVYRR
jgi:myo-inositol-1-phosphate synthase